MRGGKSPTQTRTGTGSAEAQHIKKSSEHLLAGFQMKSQFIEQHKHEFSIAVMCNVLGVSESGFYAWRKRPACQRTREEAHLTQEIRQVFATHRGRYGSPRIYRELKDQGRSTSRKRVARLMREAELSARRKQRRALTTRRDVSHPVAPNVFNREFTATEPNQKWVTDVRHVSAYEIPAQAGEGESSAPLGHGLT
jgi:putative transposase